MAAVCRKNGREIREHSFRTHEYSKLEKNLKFYQMKAGCPCQLFDEVDNPKDFIERGFLHCLKSELGPHTSVYGYTQVECKWCHRVYDNYMRDYHYIWWEWIEKT